MGMPVRNCHPLLLILLLASCRHPADTLFTALPASQTGIRFANNLEPAQNLSILKYIYYYNGGGVSTGDINGDGLPDIYFTANSRGNNKLYLNKGDFRFEDITEAAGVAGTADWCSGTTMADVNGDGLLDIYVCAIAQMHGLQGHNELFINKGNGVFAESAAAYGLAFSGFSTQSVFFDYDRDGDLDCYLLNQSEHPNQHIVDTSNRRKPDLYAGDRLYRNDGGKFTDVSTQAGIYQSSLGYGLGIAVADLNGDGWDDIYVGNDFHENDYYYVNGGNGTFTESGARHFRHYSRYSMGNDAADFNNDGQMDLITADMLPGDEKTLKTYGNGEHLDTYNQKIVRNGYQDQYSRNCLQRNNGAGASFSDVGLIGGLSATDWSWSPLFADLDNDGNKDLLISSGIVKRPLDLDFIMFFSGIRNPAEYGSPEQFEKTLLDKMPDGASHPYLFRGDGQLHFSDQSEAWGTAGLQGYSNGASCADLDGDGNQDLVLNCINAPALVLKNGAPRKNYLTLSFKGEGGNTAGIGVKAWVFTKGRMQYQQLMLTRGFQSSGEPRLHFGLDDSPVADSILVVWPNQQCELQKRVAANRQLVFEQGHAQQHYVPERFFPTRLPPCEDITAQAGLDWKHREDNYLDFNSSYLIPHLESTRGPKLAVADVNGDGLDDFFVCGAAGQSGCLMIQQKGGKFIRSDTAVFSRNRGCEGVDAAFFDANSDGYADLVVVSGGNEYKNGDSLLADHLYINDGRGHFSEPAGLLPAILRNKSCVAVADADKDGSNDLFIGGLNDPAAYGVAQPSYLLLGDGKGHFKQADRSVIALAGTGMVTSAAFADVNKDGWPDLVIAGEWMPLNIYINHKGSFKAMPVPHSSGLWQTVHVCDINGDGYADILAGNWGRNSKLSAGKDGPLKLYIKDFDNNGIFEQVLTYSIRGHEYPFLGKDQLELALPSLKAAHLSYDEVAGQPVQYTFGERLAGCLELQAETLGSACFLNDGRGNFTLKELPDELQLAPVFSFSSIPGSNQASYFAAGNFYGVLPYEGRYDAMLPSVFDYDKNAARFDIGASMPEQEGEVRDAKWINYRGKKVLVVARNNGRLGFLKFL